MQELKCLEGIRSLGNINNKTIVELTTNKGTEILRLPYKEILFKDDTDRFEYLMSIKQFCNARNISYRSYFKFKHKNCI